MDDQPADGVEPLVPQDGGSVDPARQALADEAEAIRRLIEAGAQSPEDLRLLAERMREHRAREEALWRSEVKPQLVKARKGSLAIGHLRREAPPERSGSGRSLLTGLALLGVVLLVVLLASSGSILWILLPVVGVLAAAWWQGRHGTPPNADPPA